MGQPGLFFVYFWSFQTNIITIFTTNICEKCPSSILCRDSNPRPLECEPLPITTRPGLPPNLKVLYRPVRSFKERERESVLPFTSSCIILTHFRLFSFFLPPRDGHGVRFKNAWQRHRHPRRLRRHTRVLRVGVLHDDAGDDDELCVETAMWPDVKLKCSQSFPKSCPKCSHYIFLFEKSCFSNYPKGPQIFGLLL